MKKEDIYLHTYQDFREARRAILEYIEGWYNRKRIHSAIGYMTPQQIQQISKEYQQIPLFFLISVYQISLYLHLKYNLPCQDNLLLHILVLLNFFFLQPPYTISPQSEKQYIS